MELPTRDQILVTLQRYPNSTVEELSRQLQLTRADVRYHINALLKAGHVIQMQRFPKDGHAARGRPAKSYQLSTESRPDILTRLSAILLDMIQSNADAEACQDELARRLILAQAPSGAETHAIGRLNAAIQSINQYPYQASWEAHAGGPQVFFHNCPFAAIIRKHPELCQVDRQILQNLTGLPAHQARKIDLDGPTVPACVFVLTQNR